MNKNFNYRKIESILYSYTHLKDEIERLDKEMNNVSTLDLESKQDELREVEKKVDFVERSIDMLNENEKRLVEAKYFKGRSIWGKKVNEIIEKINLRMVV